jgi:hypothetical protein
MLLASVLVLSFLGLALIFTALYLNRDVRAGLKLPFFTFVFESRDRRQGTDTRKSIASKRKGMIETENQ